MQINTNNALSSSHLAKNSIGGIRLPNFNGDYNYTKTKTQKKDSEYEKEIREQAYKDYKNGKFQNASADFVKLMKQYVSEVSPDRRAIITNGLKVVEQNKKVPNKPINEVEIILNGKIEYQKMPSGQTDYMEFYDENGEMVATYSQNGWTINTTNAETARQIRMCNIYNSAWKAASKNESVSGEVKTNASNAAYPIEDIGIKNTQKSPYQKNGCQTDNISISDASAELQNLGKLKAKAINEFAQFPYMGEVKEIPAEYICEDLFKLDLKASSVSGGENLFQSCPEEQFQVFEKWIEEKNLPEDIAEKIRVGVRNATRDIDLLNGQEGYRGTSVESVALLSASISALETLNDTVVPKEMQADFSKFIDEYAKFNEESRNRIMEKMTPDFVVVEFGETTKYQYRDEILSKQYDFYNQEKSEIEGILKNYRQGNYSRENASAAMQDYMQGISTTYSFKMDMEGLLQKMFVLL